MSVHAQSGHAETARRCPLLRVERTSHLGGATSVFVKGFGCRPLEGRRRVFGGPASESLQGRKPRWGKVEPCRRRYGDLRVAGEVCDWGGADPASRATVKRLVNERRIASNIMNCRAI